MSQTNITWKWFNPSTKQWIVASESDSIEEEYQDEINNKRSGQMVYHCFGNGSTALIDFDRMYTYSGDRSKYGNNMTFELRREVN